ncbi:TPA: phage tail protein, partial [Escherichia coli]
ATNSTSEVLAATPKAVKAAYDLANGKQAADATLTALAALATAADKLPYFTGVDRAALTALTSVGRAILGKTSIQSVLDYLGLGEAAKRNVGTGTNQIPDMSSFTSGNGWCRYPDGTIFQRGVSVAGAIGSPTFINFPIAFTNYSTVQIVVSYDNAESAVNSIPSFAATPVSTGLGFSLMGSQPSGSNTTYCRWIAIGK